jgi:hypothetical protein
VTYRVPIAPPSAAAATCSAVFGLHSGGWLFALFLPYVDRTKVQKKLRQPAVDAWANDWSSLAPEAGSNRHALLVAADLMSAVSANFITRADGLPVSRTRYPWMMSPLSRTTGGLKAPLRPAF